MPVSETSIPQFTSKDLSDPSLWRLNSVFKTIFEAIGNQSSVQQQITQSITNVTNTFGGGGGSTGPIVNPTTFTTSAIQDAIDALPANGGIVQLASGTYAYDGKITTKDKVWIRGNGSATVIERSADVDDGYGIINVEGANVYLSDFLIDGLVTTPTKHLYADFSSDPMDLLLTKNTSIWVKPGAKEVAIEGLWITHTGGYGILIDADTADVENTYINACVFYQNRPHLFGLVSGDISGTNGYGSWTGGIFYRGDCRTSAAKPYAVRGLTVTNCIWRRNTGNCLWGHCYGFDTHHTNINFIGNDFEDCGLDGILVGNVAGGTVKGNLFHRVGYITQTDIDAPEPRFLPAKNAVGLDTSGYARGLNYDGNIFISVNGEYIDCDGLRDSSVTNNVGIIPGSGDAQYTEDSVASYYDNGFGVNTTRGIQLGNTSQNGGARNVKIVGNTLIGCGMSSIVLAFAKGCTCADNRIVQLSDSAEVPIQLYAATGASPAEEWLCYDNAVEHNSIEYTASNFCIAETGAGWTTSHVNRVFNNRTSGANYGEFLRTANSASTVGFAMGTNSPTENAATARKRSIMAREGSDSTGAFKLYVENVDTGAKTQILQVSDANQALNVSNNGGAKTGVVATADRTSFAFPDVVATGKLYGDSALILTDTTLTYPNDTDLDLLDGDYGLIRFNSTSHVFEQSTSVSGGHRVWSALGGGSVAGSNTQVQFNDAGNMGASADFVFNKTTKQLMVYGIAASAGLAVANAFIQSDGGFLVTPGVSNADAINVPDGGVTAKQLVAKDSLFFLEETAPAASGAGQTRIYMDSTSHKARISQNGGAYADLVGAGVAGANTQVQFNDAGNMGASADLTFNKTSKLLTVSGIPGTAAIVATNAFIQSDGGFLVTSGNTATDSINSPTGGVSAKWHVATDSVIWIQESAPALSGAGQTRMYMDSTSGTLKVSMNGGPYVDLGTSQWIQSGSNIYYSAGNVGIGASSPSFPLSFGTGLGNKIALYDSGGGNGYGFGIQAGLFQVFAGAISDRVGIGYGNSGSFTETLTIKGGNVGIGMTNPSVKLQLGSGYIDSAQGYYSGHTSYQTVNIPNGGLFGRSLHGTVYTQLGQSFGPPSATTGNILGNGTIYYDTSNNTIRALVNGTWATIGTGGVSSVQANTPLSVNQSTGAVVVSISANPIFNIVQATTGLKTSIAAVDSSGRFIGNGVACYAGIAGTGFNFIYNYAFLGGNSWVYYYRAGGTDTINVGGVNYGFEGGMLTSKNGMPYNQSQVGVTTF